MPIKQEWEDWPVEWPSDDMWKKFEDWGAESEWDEDWGVWAEDPGRGRDPEGGRREIRLHDCMWAGVCLSKDHQGPPPGHGHPHQPRPPASSNPPPLQPPPNTSVLVTVGRSLLRQPPPPPPPRPETPQSEPEEAPAVSASEVTGQTPLRPVSSDHDYDEKGPRLTTDDLGVQTPSDSEEEEIDVVSVRGSVLPCRLLSAASEAVSRRLRRPAAKRKEEEELPPTVRPRKRPSPRKPSRFSTDSETESTERRSLHNNMERMRRIDLRNAFEELKLLVPGLANPGRAAKVTILKDAAAYCHELTSRGNDLGATVAALRKRQQRLRADLSRLRRHLAANR